MRALTFERPAPDASATQVADLPVPEPKPGQLSIDVRYAGVNFKDVMARRGDAGYVATWPFVPGLEVAGTVRALGPGVAGPAPGTPVAAFTDSGGLAEVAVAAAALAVPVPPGAGFARAGAATGALVTATLLLDGVGRLRDGDTVIVHGAAGGIGQAVALLARQAGARRVLGTVGAAGREAAARRFGYDAVFTRDNGVLGAVLEATHGQGVDVVLDPQGTTLLELDVRMAAPGGRIVLFGNAAGGTPGPLPGPARLMAANVAIGGFSLAALAAAAPGRVAAALEDVLERLASGALPFEVMTIDGLGGAAAAQQALADGWSGPKAVVDVAGPA